MRGLMLLGIEKKILFASSIILWLSFYYKTAPAEFLYTITHPLSFLLPLVFAKAVNLTLAVPIFLFLLMTFPSFSLVR